MDNRWNQLSLSEKNQLLGIYASKGYTDLASIISHYNSFQAGGPVPLKTPNFVQRFKEGNKRDIPVQGGHATHLLSYAERDGKYYVYPEVQPTDYNDSNSPLQYYGRDWRVAFDRAYDNNDYLEFDTEEAARNYTENYKKVPNTGAVLNGRNRGNYNILDYMRGYATGGHLYQTGGPDDPDEDKIYASSTVYKAMPDINITDERPAWQRGLTNYDWARARQYYSNPDGTINSRGMMFLKDVASKRRTGQSNYMRDVNRLAVVPNAAMLGAGALSGALTNPYLWGALGLASGAQNIEDKDYGEAALDIGLTSLGPTVQLINKGVEATKLGKTIRLATELNKATRTTKLNKSNIIPGQIGWAPKQTLSGYHASNESNFNPNFWYENWAVKTHDAPYGIYVAEGNAPESGFLAKRPFVHKVKVELEKPIVQVGEVQGKTKNGVRNQIERQAQKQGADALLFQDIKDNQLKHQNILKTLNPDTRILMDNNTNLMLNPNIQTPGLEADATRYIGLNEYDLRRLKEIANGDKILRSDISLLKYLNEGNEWDQSIDIRDIAKQELIEADKIKRAAKIIKNSTSNPKGENARKEVMEFFSSPEYQSRYKEIYSQNIGNKFRDISKTPFIQDINRVTQNAEITEEVPIVLYQNQNKDQWIAQPSALGIRNGNKISVKEGSPNEVYHHELFHISQNIAKRNKLNQDLNDIKVKPLIAKTQSKEIIKHYESIEEKRSRALSALLEWQKKGYNINDKNEINKLVNNATTQGTTNANLAQLLKLFSVEDVKKMLEDMLILSPIMIKENSKN